MIDGFPRPEHGSDRVTSRGEARGRAGSGRAGNRRAGSSGKPARSPAEPGTVPEKTVERDSSELAREICLRQLALRPRTRAELATALRKRGIADDVAAEVLDRYDEVGLVDDGAFAKAWVTTRHHGRGLARRALAGELHRKGVASDEVGEALDELDPATEEATARAMVARRLRSERQHPRRDNAAILRRLVGMLARKGYPPALAIRVVKDALAAEEESAELAEQLDVDALADAMDSADSDYEE
jgi:regulatory protein